MNDKQIKLTKSFRLELNEKLESLEQLSPSREVSLAKTKLQECIMWLGVSLSKLGTITPYTESMNSDNTIVHPTADKL